jgi:hypothetical protein
MEMSVNLETEAYEGELRKLRQVYEMVKHIGLIEKLGGIYFICGESGAKDDNDLPDNIYICPAYGCDWFQVYEKTDKTFGPEW